MRTLDSDKKEIEKVTTLRYLKLSALRCDKFSVKNERDSGKRKKRVSARQGARFYGTYEI